MTKGEIRQQMLRRRERLTGSEVEQYSRAVCQQLRHVEEVVRAPYVAVYAAVGGEIGVTELARVWLGDGKCILLPRFDASRALYEMVAVRDLERDTVMGRFGIREPRKELPCAPAHLLADRDLAWIVPGVAFDETGGRLGRGRGYYDRMLRDVLGIKVGVGYDWQVVPCLPSSSHDVRMDVIVTNSRILRCHGRLAPTRPC